MLLKYTQHELFQHKPTYDTIFKRLSQVIYSSSYIKFSLPSWRCMALIPVYSGGSLTMLGDFLCDRRDIQGRGHPLITVYIYIQLSRLPNQESLNPLDFYHRKKTVVRRIRLYRKRSHFESTLSFFTSSLYAISFNIQDGGARGVTIGS